MKCKLFLGCFDKVVVKIATFFLGIVVAGPLFASESEKPVSSQTLRAMARAYISFGYYEKALELTNQAVHQCDQSDIAETALCSIVLATVYGYLDQFDQSILYYNRGIKLQKQALSDTHPYVACSLRMLCDIYLRQKETKKAELALREAAEIMLNYCTINDKGMAPFILTAAKLFSEQGKLQKAKKSSKNHVPQFRILWK